MSLSGRRLVATLGALWLLVLVSIGVQAGPLPDSTWVALGALPGQGHTAIFALAVDPANSRALIAASSAGTVLRSTDGGSTWTAVHRGAAVVNAIVFSPIKAGLVLAGTRGGGALVSRDSGVTWSSAAGLEQRNVRAFGFALTAIFTGTDQGVFVSQDGGTWSPAGLANRSIDAIAVEAIHVPVHVVAASDSTASGAGPQLYQSNDGGQNWAPFSPAITGTFAVRLVAGPLPPTGNVRPLLVGTNTGLFASADNGATFTTLSGTEILPSTDFTQLSFINGHYNRLYAASDGGGSGAGGLWRTDDGGQTFRSLEPPMHSITALAASSDDSPVVYVATFLPAGHLAALWAYRDTGGAPQGPPATPSHFASASRTSSSGTSFHLLDFLRASQAPYIGLGALALLVIATAGVAHLRGRRR